MPLRGVTVDLWNTLVGASGNIHRQEERLRCIRSFCSHLGTEYPEAVLRRALQATWRYYYVLWRGQQRTPTSKELTAFLFRYLGISVEPAHIYQLAQKLEENVLEYPPPLLPFVRETLQGLAERYRLGLISDTAFSPGWVLRELLRRYDLADFFTAYSFSDETGVAKPHPRAYAAALEGLGVVPAEALHIGDLEATDVRGAKQLGMHAILFLGDPDSEFPPPPHTVADAVAYHWQEIPSLIGRLAGNSREDSPS
ncbi:MAG: HAD family hydrolase [Bacteroidota bacterium]|nr:HAD family hydrolase [Bacteroidota bacterium]